MSDARISPTRPWASVLAPVVIVAAVLLVRFSGSEEQATVDVSASEPLFSSVEELAAAADLIVEATITAADPGRIITDPTDPTSGIQTTVFTLEVSEAAVDPAVLTDAAPAVVTIEYETALLDGSPITVNGITAPAVGERGLYFLVGGVGQDFPHYAVINGQGRYPIDNRRLLVALSDDPLVVTVSQSTVAEVKAQLGAR